MNEENKNNIPQMEEVEVLGNLRKDSIGKPKLVIVMFVLLILVMVALPIINSMLNDENSELYKIIYGTQTNNKTQQKEDIKDLNNMQSISSSMIYKYGYLQFSNMTLNKNKLSFTVVSTNGVIDLDEEEKYLLIYSNINDLEPIAYYKLTDSQDNGEKNYQLERNDVNYNSSNTYFAKIVKMEDKDYPKVIISSDETGIGTLSCSKEDRIIEYDFLNGYLISIKDTEQFYLKNYANNNDEYLKLLESYNKKSKLLPRMSSVKENETGFIYTANINLEQEGFVLPDGINDKNYYELNTEAKIISYSQIGKGFECK